MGGLRSVGRAIRRAGHSVERTARPVMKYAIPVVASAVGGALAGPPGAAIGGGMGRAVVNHNHGNFGKNFLEGLGIGTAWHFGAPALGSGLGVSPTSGMGGLLGMQNQGANFLPSLFGRMGGAGGPFGAGSTGAGYPGGGLAGGVPSGLTFPHVGGMTPWLPGGVGIGGAAGAASSGMGGLGATGALMGGLSALGGRGQAQNPYGAPQENSGFWDNLTGEISRNPLQSLLMGTTLAGSLFGRKKNRGRGQPESIEDIMKKEGFGRESKPIRARGAQRATRQRNQESGTDWQFFEDVNPELRYEEYKKGGHVVSQYIRGNSSGQADNYKTNLKPGDFILNATVTSLMGDGNSDAGEKVWKDYERKYLESGFVRASDGGDLKIPAKLSHGEIRVPRHIVTAIGGGSNKLGAKKLNNLQKNILKHKGVKSILPPKTKPLERYMA